MFAAAVRVELRIPAAGSLKEKRRVLKRVITMLTSTYAISVAETDHQDSWQRTSLGIAIAASEAGHLEDVIDAVERALFADAELEVLSTAVSYLERPE